MTSPPTYSRYRYRYRVLLTSLIALAVIAGASAGIAGDRLLAPRIRVRAAIGDMSGVFDRLALSPEQRRRAEAIVARSAPRSEAIMLELAERLRDVADSVDAELRAILTPEQRLRRTDLLGRGAVGIPDDGELAGMHAEPTAHAEPAPARA